MLRPGDEFDRYVVEAPLGQGGMGAVYRALDTRLNRRVALKIVLLGEGADAESKARLLREARAAAALNHPNAVAVYDVGEHDGIPFIAMELVPGRTLRQYVGDATVPVETRLRWLLEVARALDAAHRAGLVHRDVKPDNVMIGNDDAIVKVLDFGIARSIRGAVDVHAETSAGALETITAQGVAIGTPLYMPPEQLRGREVDARADQFAWGVMAYELLSGVTPWSNARDALALTAAIVGEPAPPLRSRTGVVAPAVETIVMRALEKSPEARWPSMRAILEQLERTLETGRAHTAAAPVLERSSSADVPRTGKRSVLVGVSISALVLVSGALFLSTARRSARSPASSSSSSPSANRGWKRVIDRPLPSSSHADAVTAFSSGLRAAHDANWAGARQAFERAAELDPGMAEAATYVAVYNAFGDVNEARLREQYQRAFNLRDKLGERDRRFLLAFEPKVMREPPDLIESAARAVALLSSYPDDAELHVFAGYFESIRGEDTNALKLVTRAVELDPTYADALQAQGRLLARAGRVVEAMSALDGCTRASPGAADCYADRARLLEVSGDCAGVEEMARKGLSWAPNHRSLLSTRAAALVALGRASAVIDEALRAKWESADGAMRASERALDEARLAVIAGHFVRAQTLALEAERAAAIDKSARAHAVPLLLAVEVSHEMGRDDEAAKHAMSYLSRRELWAPMALLEPLPPMLHAQLLAGVITSASHDSLRSEFLARSAGERGIAWAATFSPAASSSRAHAEAAFAALPASGLPRELPFFPTGSLDVAMIQVGAGRYAEAVPRLRAQVNSCVIFHDPVRHVRASLLLGQALEGTGDTPGACGAYRAVVARWGSPNPRSVTAERARARQKALSCPDA